MLQSQNALTSQSDNGGALGSGHKAFGSPGDEAVLDFLSVMLAPATLDKNTTDARCKQTQLRLIRIFCLVSNLKGNVIKKGILLKVAAENKPQCLVYLCIETSYLCV